MSLIYRKSIAVLDKLVPQSLQPLWNHEAVKSCSWRILEEAYILSVPVINKSKTLRAARIIRVGSSVTKTPKPKVTDFSTGIFPEVQSYIKNIFHYTKFVNVNLKLVPKNIFLGPKTVFFWAPVVKWGLVIAGIGDLNRPAENLSVSQSASLTATGFIWARYSLVIIPKNWSLFSVNMFVGGTNCFQLFRAINYQRSLQKGTNPA